MDHSNFDRYHSLNGVPAMTSSQVHQYLEELGQTWSGHGIAMELGCWLGASSVALLNGLVKAGYNKPYWAFDNWTANKDQIPKAKAQGIVLVKNQNTQPLFLNNVWKVYRQVHSCRGLLPNTLKHYSGDPIEFCIFDAPKSNPVFIDCIQALSSYWIPGVTVLGLLDYYFYIRHKGKMREKFRAPVDFMELYGDHFSIQKQWKNESVVFFKFLKKFI